MEENFEINIAHLYPDILNIYGDLGNIATLKNRLEWRNIKVIVENISLNSEIDYKKYDIFYIGGGQEQLNKNVSDELLKHKAELKKLADNGVVMLAVCAGYQLFSNYFQDKNGNKIDGLGIFDAYTIATEKRLTGNVTVKTDFLTPETLVGFENHSGLTYLQNDTKPLGNILTGNGNNFKDKQEGARYNNVFGTYLHGPILPKNPEFCDYLLLMAIRRKLNDNNYILEKLDDDIENLTHSLLVNKPY